MKTVYPQCRRLSIMLVISYSIVYLSVYHVSYRSISPIQWFLPPFFVPPGHNYYLRLNNIWIPTFFLEFFLNTIKYYSFWSALQLNNSSALYGTLLNVHLTWTCKMFCRYLNVHGCEMMASKEEASLPWQGKEAAIHGAVAGQGHKHRHCYREVPHQLLCKSLWQVETEGDTQREQSEQEYLLLRGC